MFPADPAISELANPGDGFRPSPPGVNEVLKLHSDGMAALVSALGFVLRAWMAHATYFNVDEAWHYSVANQDSLRHAYRASLTLYHPPLLVLVLYFWKTLGTSDLMLRLPCVVAGSVFCCLYYKWLDSILGKTVAWVGLLLVTFLPTFVSISADLRQYPLMLMFLMGAACLLERSFAKDSAGLMLLSSMCLLLAMLSHYSAFLFAAAVGVYAILRMATQRFSVRLIAAWVSGQATGLALAGFLYVTQIAKLDAAYAVSQSLQRNAAWYLPQFYYHPQDHLLLFLFRGTFGIFRFMFAWVVIGHVATLLFVAGVIILLRRKSTPGVYPAPRLCGILLLIPFVVNWAAVATGLYPYGRTRQCIFLAIFGIAGVSVSVAAIARPKMLPALAIALTIVLLCQVWGTTPGRDMLPLADQRREHMDRALDFIRRNVSVKDVIYLNKSTEFQLGHYLCDQKPVALDHSVAGFESFQCHGLRVISTSPNDDAILLDTFPSKWRQMALAYGLAPGSKVWIVQGGWTSGFAESLRARFPELPELDSHSFGHYLQIFHLTVGEVSPVAHIILSDKASRKRMFFVSSVSN